MTDASTPFDENLARLMIRLTKLEDSAKSELELVEERLPELRRQARAKPKRRGGAGSADADKYALGSVLKLCGFSAEDELPLLGFFACGDRALSWLVETRIEYGPMTFAQTIKAAMQDPKRREWCTQWGDYRRRVYKKAVYEASVTSFLESGKTGPNEKWRRRGITSEQFDVIEDICEARKLPAPVLSNRGEAFDWILNHRGNPAHWEEPKMPDDLED